MKINVLQVKREVGARQSFSFMPSAKEIGLSEEREWQAASIRVNGEVINNGRFLEIVGVIHGQANFDCHRCLADFSTTLEISFAEDFQETTGEDKPDAGHANYQGDEIDITELVREYLLLAEPMKTLCREDCKGLCPKCGANLNHNSCSCVKGDFDPRLAPLERFLKKNEL
jgi:uncharacterized protein